MSLRRRKRSDKGRDPFEHLADDRREAEAEPWFLAPDDGPELDVRAGFSSNLVDADLDKVATSNPDDDTDPDSADEG